MYSLCLDCGATNVRAMIVDEQGVIVGKASQPNATLPGEENPEFHVWDADRIFRQLSECAVKALEGLNAEQVTAVTITTFGVDGALVDDAGNLLYPVISWKCPRTAEVMKNIGKYISQEELNRISGVGPCFQHHLQTRLAQGKPPGTSGKSPCVALHLQPAGLQAHRHHGDRPDHGRDLPAHGSGNGRFSEFILNCLGLSRGLFPPIVDAGNHWPPYAGSGRRDESPGPGGAFPLSPPGTTPSSPFSVPEQTRTSPSFPPEHGNPDGALHRPGWPGKIMRTAPAEFDAESGLLNPGLQWLGSGIIEWVKAAAFTGNPMTPWMRKRPPSHPAATA